MTDKSYLQEVKIMHSAEVVDGTSSLQAMWDTNMEVEYHPTWTTEMVYICPRGISIYRGNPSACGRQCIRVQGHAEKEYDEEKVLKVLVIRRQALFK
jgi:BTB/POZ domain-containing protein KCTD9